MKGEDEGVGNLLDARVVPALPNYVSTPTRQEVPIDQVRRLDGRRSRLNRWEGWVVCGLSIRGFRARNQVAESCFSDSPRPTGRGEATRCHLPLASTKLTFLGSVAVPAIRRVPGWPLDLLHVSPCSPVLLL